MEVKSMATFNTDRFGRSFDHDTKSAVWWKTQPIAGVDHAVAGLDACGAVIHWREYGNTASKHGWEIDHIVAKANGGSDDLSNLQPLQWENNRFKGDKPMSQPYCVVR